MKIILFVCMIIISKLSIAGDTGYEVEVIIFEDSTELYKNSENWPTEIPETDIIDAAINSEQDKVPSIPKSDINVIFEFLEDDKYRLNEQALKLQKNERYNVLYHKAWKQPGLDRNSAIPLAINTQQQATPETQNIEEKSTSYVTGNFTLIMSRYLHVVSDLILYKPARTENIQINDNSVNSDLENTVIIQPIPPAAFDQYNLLFERRMRSKEIHYIDHPMGGMIVLATPFKIQKKGGTKTDQSATDYKTL